MSKEYKFALTASMMCADFGNLEREVRDLEAAGIDSFHIDIMDGRYVNNFAMSLYDMQFIARATKLPLDVHLMIEHPRNNIDIFLKVLRPGDTVYIHPEAEYHPSTTLQKVIDAGMHPGIAINPGTSVESIKEQLLVMSVNPGNAGQMFLPYVGEKIEQLIKLRQKMGFTLFWDGACGAERMMEYAPHGVDGFVLGTTLLFGQKAGYKEILESVRVLNFDYLKAGKADRSGCC